MYGDRHGTRVSSVVLALSTRTLGKYFLPIPSSSMAVVAERCWSGNRVPEDAALEGPQGGPMTLARVVGIRWMRDAQDRSLWRRLGKPMSNGGRLLGSFFGLLVLTGVLWGCTNPFIRQGTKGLRDVTATTVSGQIWAEVTFLLGNWKYVLPWLVNQAGSLSYLAAVQRAPLSVAVPVANSLAFVFTAITGASVGAEEPLDARSIMGIVLIMAGTALCCLDDTS